MKKTIAFLLTMITLLSFTSCDSDPPTLQYFDEENSTSQSKNTTHNHSWIDATCTSPKICSICKKTDGEMLGHSWENATCTAPKTCSACKETDGEMLGHSWENATCTAPKTCSVCEETDGEMLGHSWYNYVCKQCTISNKIIVGKTTSLQSFEAYSDSSVQIILPTVTNYYEIMDFSGNKVICKNLGYSTKTSTVTHKLNPASYTLIFYYYMDVTTTMQPVRGADGSYSYQYVTTGAGSQYMGMCSIKIN